MGRASRCEPAVGAVGHLGAGVWWCRPPGDQRRRLLADGVGVGVPRPPLADSAGAPPQTRHRVRQARDRAARSAGRAARVGAALGYLELVTDTALQGGRAASRLRMRGRCAHAPRPIGLAARSPRRYLGGDRARLRLRPSDPALPGPVRTGSDTSARAPDRILERRSDCSLRSGSSSPSASWHTRDCTCAGPGRCVERRARGDALLHVQPRCLVGACARVARRRSRPPAKTPTDCRRAGRCACSAACVWLASREDALSTRGSAISDAADAGHRLALAILALALAAAVGRARLRGARSNGCIHRCASGARSPSC